MAILSSPLQIISSTPITTRSFTAATIGFSLLYLLLQWQSGIPHSTPYLTLSPGASIFYPWTFVTAGLVEQSIIELLFSLIFVPASLRYLERLWGSLETLKFILVVITVSNIISFIVNWLEFVLFRADFLLYGTDYCGQMALQTGILVAFTQLIPEHQVQVFGILKVRVKRLPMAYVTLSTVLVLLGFQSPWILIQFGWLVAWVYLRFYKKNRGDSVVGDSYGDRSETFAFIYWFPPFLHTPIGILSDFAHSLATRLHIIPTSGPDLESGGYSQLPGGPRAEAERRRALALKALDQRIASAATPPRELGSKAPGLSSTAPSSAPSEGPSDGDKAQPERRKSVGEADIGLARSDSKGKNRQKSES